MARKKAASPKRSVSRPACRGRQPAAPRARSRGSIPPAKLKRLKTLLKEHRDGSRTASWKLGKLATEVLEQAERSGNTQPTTSKLAQDIGLLRKPVGGREKTDDSTPRQMIKFAEVADYSQTPELRKAGISWRGIVYWLGVKNHRNRSQLYRVLPVSVHEVIWPAWYRQPSTDDGSEDG